MKLREDEQYIIDWMSQYGAIKKSQLVRMLWNKSKATAERIIKRLSSELLITHINIEDFYALDSLYKPDQRLTLALWVLLEFIEKIDPMSHYPATCPSQIFFLKENIGYEIVVLFEDEQHLLRVLQPQEEDMRYILVIPDVSMVQSLLLPKNPCIFATVVFKEETDPEVVFYSTSLGEGSGEDEISI